MTCVAFDTFPAGAASVPAARHMAAATLRRWAVDEAARDSAGLIVSELITNAQRAADGHVALRLTLGAGLVIEVWDGSDLPPVPADGPASDAADADAEGGRGLAIVAALSTRTAWYRTRGGGKVVWAQLPAHIPALRPVGHADTLARRGPLPRQIPVLPLGAADDLALLQRVVDGLRALDDWHRPPDVARGRGDPAGVGPVRPGGAGR
ncbi:Histidine kinase-like ATPase domain [Frankia torreyi]|uniref:Histidine kinase-like ATPase domain n=1 Tax=Frankia torreyi TaxID=1856 RepID=A0A0D8B7H7_9ACTN|nr:MULTISPECIES: ATP-binding protein [Frankia]KJE19327.1 Histidine kinase-like ATPase domain [Frankia torreyi]KQM03599.1 Histidine kinase-like ATPase domain [Frankia sp. CpI1-P]